jgi:hypothetical protein
LKGEWIVCLKKRPAIREGKILRILGRDYTLTENPYMFVKAYRSPILPRCTFEAECTDELENTYRLVWEPFSKEMHTCIFRCPHDDNSTFCDWERPVEIVRIIED